MLVLLIGFPSSVGDFSVFADDDDDNDNLKVSAEESKAYKKQLEKAEKARDEAEKRKEKFEQKYNKFTDFNSKVWNEKKAKDLSLKDAISIPIPESLSQFEKDLKSMHNLK